MSLEAGFPTPITLAKVVAACYQHLANPFDECKARAGIFRGLAYDMLGANSTRARYY
jgi:hypothetical protein